MNAHQQHRLRVQPQSQAFPITEAAGGAPEIFVDGVVSVSTNNGATKFCMASLVHTDAEHPEQRIVVRVVMPVACLVGFYEIVGRTLHQVQEHMAREQGRLEEAARAN